MVQRDIYRQLEAASYYSVQACGRPPSRSHLTHTPSYRADSLLACRCTSRKKDHTNLLVALRNQAGRPMGAPVELLPWLGLAWAGLTWSDLT